ncbi:response regulator transcription factor [Granulosicoccus antarcticus]|uniref:Tetrathionate response regulatory protein TtrR n=1 Tax=Granulosicoccus antarcticus IMCC3135 TaxID=1192854 RepID=A0A2Z2NNU8_9GAMM|nr:response regulator [Granulosicoccus antarcticus]ASJ70510.1 Tetrathionate response regulatory protein TtrR [Granulosicoccus antarcticus IMCC3135]
MNEQQIFILDDNDDFRESTAFLLEAMGYSVEHYGEHDTALQAMVKVGKEQPACLLLDIRMPEISGLDVHDLMQEREIDLPVIYMTAHGDVPLAVAAMEKGALTFLEKPLEDDELQAALDRALSDKVQKQRISAEERAALAESRKRLEELTLREREVAYGIVSDLSNKLIARQMSISVKTVELHRSRAMKKMEARNAAHLVRIIIACDAD